jgi:hypothetical protein
MGGQTGFGPVPVGEDGEPARPAGTDALDAEQLTALVTRNGLIGTALV